ncbi:MAG: GcvT family protein [Solirubrobacteraceae bacterium]
MADPELSELPDRARVVIIGAGAAGASIAYHLAKLGEHDVILLERHEAGAGSTRQSAAMVGQMRGSVALTRLMMDSVATYRQLECGWVQSGSVTLACSHEREHEIMRQIACARALGLPLELLTPDEARGLFPLISTDAVRCASHLPTDGYLDPEALIDALLEGARAGGCRVFSHRPVTGIEVRHGRVSAVGTDDGQIEAELVVIAGGMFAAEIGRMAGIRVPVIPFLHQYLVTDPFRQFTDGEHLPVLYDPDLLIYLREQGAGLLMGGYERDSAPWSLDGKLLDRIPSDYDGRALDEDWPRFDEISDSLRRRLPDMEDLPGARVINAPEAFTPDGEPCIGESEVRGLFVAAGFSGHGVAAAGGVGRLMAEWTLTGEPPADVWPLDIRRFGPQYRSPAYTLRRAVEVYEGHDDVRYPGRERHTGRPLRISSAYEWHLVHGASFGEVAGWERVNWYESNAPGGDESLRPRDWAGIDWSPAIGAEHRAARETAGLFDESSLAKLELSGPGAAALLERLCDNHVARDVGEIAYTQMCNERGGIECNVTVARVEEELFQIVTATAFGGHDMSWIRRHLPDDGSVRLVDVTSSWACFGLWGPRAHDILARLTPDPLDFAYMRLREVSVGDVPVRALRVTSVGEQGWELYCPTEYGSGLWRALWGAGREHGLVAGGYRAIDSLRLEKGYRVWAADISPERTPYQAGLGAFVREDKEFIGCEALREARDAMSGGDGSAPPSPAGEGDGGPPRLRCIVLEDPLSVALGNEPVRAGDEIVGSVTSGGYGYTVECSIAYAYLPAALDIGAEVEIDIFGRWVKGEVAPEPLFDPAGVRVRRRSLP